MSDILLTKPLRSRYWGDGGGGMSLLNSTKPPEACLPKPLTNIYIYYISSEEAARYAAGQDGGDRHWLQALRRALGL